MCQNALKVCHNAIIVCQNEFRESEGFDCVSNTLRVRWNKCIECFKMLSECDRMLLVSVGTLRVCMNGLNMC